MPGRRGPKPQGAFNELTADFRETRRGTRTVVKKVRTEYATETGETPAPSRVPAVEQGHVHLHEGNPTFDAQYNELRGPSIEPRKAKVSGSKERPQP